MKVNIQTLHFTSHNGLNEYVNEKVGKLAHFFERISEGNVCLKLEKSDTADNKVCEIRLSVPGNDLFAERRASTFEEAVTQTVDALERQIEKMKTKFQK